MHWGVRHDTERRLGVDEVISPPAAKPRNDRPFPALFSPFVDVNKRRIRERSKYGSARAVSRPRTPRFHSVQDGHIASFAGLGARSRNVFPKRVGQKLTAPHKVPSNLLAAH
jgi:hypothetical protein